MNRFLLIFLFIMRTIYSLRYKVEIRKINPEVLDQLKGGTLFLPNHPAHIDPFILFFWLWPKYRMRPLVVEFAYRVAWLQPLMRLARAIPIPDFEDSVNQLKIKKAEKALNEVAAGLKQGDTIVLYPARKLKTDGKEVVGGSSGAHDLLQKLPETHAILIRTTGLWGSSFSKALTGKSPDPNAVLFGHIKTIFKNLIFFTPRRKITIELEADPADLPRNGSRIEFNHYLENWYNQYTDDEGNIQESEPLKLVSYSCWRKELLQIQNGKKNKAIIRNVSVSAETSKKVIAEIRKILNNPSLSITPEMSLTHDLGMDSLNIAELISFLSMKFDVEEVHPEDLEKVLNVLQIAEGAQVSKISEIRISKTRWPKEKNRPKIQLPPGNTFSEAFFNTCKRMSSFAACADDQIGVLSYKKMKRAILVIAEYFRTLPDPQIAIMLPASAGTNILVLAVLAAGKVPVMLNWTLGPRYLEEMMKLSGAQRVITSWRFLDRLSSVDFGTLIDQMEVFEDLRQSLTLKMKLRGAILSLLPVKTLMKTLSLDQIDENSPAVILFTSGSEATPKGVPLSHKNILSNLTSIRPCVDVSPDDSGLCFLPLFHSLGFTMASIFPLFAGVRVCFYPDPTDSFAIAAEIEKWEITLIAGPPNFLKAILNTAKTEQLKTLRYLLSGAEKVPQELFDLAHSKTEAKLIEGYGITECSPVISVNRFNLPSKGVGLPLPGIEFCMIHPETEELLPKGSEGEICVRGPNVFQGYLGNVQSPFIQIDGKQWYRTGDIGQFDEQGYLTLSGRLKRFTKLGGEMISLGAIEEVLKNELIRRGEISNETPSLAICVDEREEGKPRLVLLSTITIERDLANEILWQSGFSKLVKIATVQTIEEIPVFGTGKTNYRDLQKLL